jgi:hypothetical protein
VKFLISLSPILFSLGRGKERGKLFPRYEFPQYLVRDEESYPTG